MKKLLLLIAAIFLLYGESFVPQSVIDAVDKKYGRFAKARFEALQKMLDSLDGKDIDKQLLEVNNFFNKVGYGSDSKIFGVSDYWATPFEFLARDKGDCEDYVIAKYFALRHLGVPSDKLYFSYVRVDGYDDAHMVLTYFESKNAAPLVLDNINKRILPASERKDLKPVYNFNPNVLEGGKKTNAHKQWDSLMKRIKENKI